MNDIIALVGILSGIAIPLAVFIWLYYDAKNKRAAIIEVAKTIDDPLVAVKSAAASLTPLRYTSANPLSYARALPDVSLPDTVSWPPVSVYANRALVPFIEDPALIQPPDARTLRTSEPVSK